MAFHPFFTRSLKIIENPPATDWDTKPFPEFSSHWNFSSVSPHKTTPKFAYHWVNTFANFRLFHISTLQLCHISRIFPFPWILFTIWVFSHTKSNRNITLITPFDYLYSFFENICGFLCCFCFQLVMLITSNIAALC